MRLSLRLLSPPPPVSRPPLLSPVVSPSEDADGDKKKKDKKKKKGEKEEEKKKKGPSKATVKAMQEALAKMKEVRHAGKCSRRAAAGGRAPV